jgi:superoxide reductase
MIEVNQVYKCAVCGNIVEVTHAGGGVMVCCGQPMMLLEEKTQDPELGEKHVPIIIEGEGFIKIQIGSVPHPMEDKHYIEWIEIIDPETNDILKRKYLKPGENPELVLSEADCMAMSKNINNLAVREFCNIHLLWAKK